MSQKLIMNQIVTSNLKIINPNKNNSSKVVEKIIFLSARKKKPKNNSSEIKTGKGANLGLTLVNRKLIKESN